MLNITIDILDNMTAEQLDAITAAQQLLADARRDLTTVKTYCRFKLEETCLTLNDSMNTKEYMLHNGTYQARQGGKVFELAMTDEAIFEAYKLWAQSSNSAQAYRDVSLFKNRVAAMRQFLETAEE